MLAGTVGLWIADPGGCATIVGTAGIFPANGCTGGTFPGSCAIGLLICVGGGGEAFLMSAGYRVRLRGKITGSE